jgi:hypothetical protein
MIRALDYIIEQEKQINKEEKAFSPRYFVEQNYPKEVH